MTTRPLNVDDNEEEDEDMSTEQSEHLLPRPENSLTFARRPQWVLTFCGECIHPMTPMSIQYPFTTAGLGAICMGTLLGWSSSAVPAIAFEWNLTIQQQSWISSLMPVGAAVGGSLAGIPSDRLGRKISLLFLCLPFLGSWLLLIYATTLTELYIGRVLLGVCAGVVCGIVPGT